MCVSLCRGTGGGNWLRGQRGHLSLTVITPEKPFLGPKSLTHVVWSKASESSSAGLCRAFSTPFIDLEIVTGCAMFPRLPRPQNPIFAKPLFVEHTLSGAHSTAEAVAGNLTL